MPVLKSLLDKQDKSLWLAARPAVDNVEEMHEFLGSVGICLRYWPTKGLPLASAYQAGTGKGPKDEGQRNAIELTNQLMSGTDVIEVNVIANRLCLAHEFMMPSLYKLVTRGRKSFPLSQNAVKAYKLIEDKEQISAGELRKVLGAGAGLQEDPAYLALAELQRWLLVDRGPFKITKKGIPYLPKEGYPYHLFRDEHPSFVREAAKISVPRAAEDFILGYLKGALFASLKKMSAMFKLFLEPVEITEAADRLKSQKKVSLEVMGRDLCARLK